MKTIIRLFISLSGGIKSFGRVIAKTMILQGSEPESESL